MAFAPRLLLPPRPPAPAAASARHNGGRTAPELSGPTPRVVVVTSGKGGVGKTTTTANLAASLARLNFPVVAIDADAGLRNLDLLLGLENRVHLTAADVLAGDCRLDQALIRHRSLQGLHLLCLSKPRSKLPLAFGSKTLTWVADALRRSATPPAFILIDCPADPPNPSPSRTNGVRAAAPPSPEAPRAGGGLRAPQRRAHGAGDVGLTPRVVVVTSGKGGVGKTTTTANLAASLARLNFPVVAIDADAGLRNLDLLLGLENRVHLTAADVLAGDCRLDQALVRHRSLQGLHLFCLSKPRSKLPLAFGSKTLTWVADALRRSATPPAFILIDCPAGVDAGFVTAIAPAEEAVLVTTPDITALRDADRVAGLLECDGIKDIKIIVNRVRPDLVRGEDMMSALDVQEMLGLPLLGVVPEDSEVIRSTNRGMPLVLMDPPTPAGLALERATWRLVERDAMTAVMVEEQERPKKKGGFFFSLFGG